MVFRRPAWPLLTRQGRTTILRINYRNTRQVLDLASRFARELLAPEEAEDDGIPLVGPESAGRDGSEPTVIALPSLPGEIDYVVRHLQRLHAQGRQWREMAILYRRRDGSPADADSVKVVPMHSSKGLEFPVVAVTGLGEMDTHEEKLAEETRLLYVAMTRAMDELIITGSPNAPFLQRIQHARGAH